MNIKELIVTINEQIAEVTKDIQFSLDDLRNYTQDGNKEKAIKEIDRILNKLEEL